MSLIDKSHIGRRFARATRTVEAGRLRFFLDVIGAEPAEKSELLRVPPTYLFCLEMMDEPDPLLWLKDLGVNLLHILHGQQRFEYHAPVHAGQTLSFDAVIADIYDKKNGALQFVVKRTEVRDAAELLVATLLSTVVYRRPA